MSDTKVYIRCLYVDETMVMEDGASSFKLNCLRCYPRWEPGLYRGVYLSLTYSQMPKGALLHAHLDATVNAEYLLKLALKEPAIHIRVPHAITALNIGSTLPEFLPLPKDQFSGASLSGLTDAAYSDNSWVSIQRARETFDTALGGPEGFDRWVIGSMTINPTEAYKTHNTVTKARFRLPCM